MTAIRQEAMEMLERIPEDNINEVKISYAGFFKSIVDQDRTSVVICNLQHEILYMNPAAISNYAKRGGEKLIGRSLLECHNPESRERIQQVIDWFAADESHNLGKWMDKRKI